MKMIQSLLIALIPATIAALWFFRLNALILISVSIVFAVGAEVLWQLAAKLPIRIRDLSAVSTGLLFGLTLGPSLPWYLAALGASLSIVAGKAIWGGFGKNIFNPALFGRFIIVVLFPGAMAPFLTPVDMVTTATPLQIFRAEGVVTRIFNLFTGNVAGCIGETSVMALALGFAWLVYKGHANWRIPLAAFISVTILSLLAGHNPLFHLFSGSLMLGALFMATDPVTSPKQNSGRWIFGAAIGLIIMVFRFWSPFPEGTMFAILGMNMLVPIINAHTKANKISKESENK
ncbi:RnfABCDGE type electron transport complex subunit D [Candidatus Acetothermia bacterium]|nr:RnfABCDGE type electron transport complex subunit D [Candidatus Acetothermia bacterium]